VCVVYNILQNLFVVIAGNALRSRGKLVPPPSRIVSRFKVHKTLIYIWDAY
jgi:hypothetical protein